MKSLKTWQPDFVGDGAVRYFSFARYAMIEALTLAGVGVGDPVLLPSYLCRDILAVLNQIGAIPYWYDVTIDLAPKMPPDNWPFSKAVLMVNYFGFPQNLQPFLDYSRRTGAKIIEDNAHGYLSADTNGLWLGCRTGLGIFSLRKTLRIPDGASLWVDQKNINGEVPHQLLFNGSGIKSAQLTKAYLRSLPLIGNSFYQLAIYLARIVRKLRTGSELPKSSLDFEKTLPGSPNPWTGLMKALSSFDLTKEVKRRRTAYQQCDEFAALVGAKPVFSSLPIFCSPYGYAFRGNEGVLLAMRRFSSKRGFDLVSWPDLPNEIINSAPVYYKNIHLINFIW